MLPCTAQRGEALRALGLRGRHSTGGRAGREIWAFGPSSALGRVTSGLKGSWDSKDRLSLRQDSVGS